MTNIDPIRVSFLRNRTDRKCCVYPMRKPSLVATQQGYPKERNMQNIESVNIEYIYVKIKQTGLTQVSSSKLLYCEYKDQNLILIFC